MRIAQRSMYKSFITGMNKNLSDYMESNIQSSSQKRINRPSDDPIGMTRVLAYRASIQQNKQYEINSQDVSSWLSSTDSALTQAQVILSKIKEKAEQASTGTVTSEQRLIIAGEVRELFGQLINLSNTGFAGQKLFAGHKYNQNAYEQGLGITTQDPNLQTATRVDGSDSPIAWDVQGAATRTIMVRFDDSGDIGGPVDLDYSFSKDGGETWTTKTLLAGDTTLDLDGATITMPKAGSNPTDLQANLHVDAYDPDQPTAMNNGTMLFVRPTAYYQGDTNDLPPTVDIYGSSRLSSVNAYGSFATDVRIRMDSAADPSAAGTASYSYSTDNGITWVTAEAATTNAGGTFVRLQIPGGYVDVAPLPGQLIEEGQQFVVRPRRSELGVEISEGEFMSTTNCGKDIFGGVYNKNGEAVATAAEGGAKNIFETISNFIAWAESGIQGGCQQVLDDLTTSMEGLTTKIAGIGGKINRVSLNLSILESNRDDKTSRMSKIEDADLTELLTRITQQQLAYQTVLQSSSMIMQLNLAKFL